MKKQGYTLVKGKKGEAVGKAATIYASRLCKSDIIRAGFGVKGGKDYYNYHFDDTTFEADKAARLGKDELVDNYRSVYDTDLQKYKKKDAPQEESNEPKLYVEGDPNKDGTLTQHPKYIEVSVVHEEKITKLEKFQKHIDELNEISFPVVGSINMTQWFDDMEALIDALPEMNEDTTEVYFVEYDDTREDWFYTGESGVRDPAWNNKITKGKSAVCAWLNTQAQKVSDKVTSTLQDLANRTTACKPFTTAMETIQKVPSLDTVIKWATAVIDYFLAQYKLIKAYFDMIMTMLEIVIVRFPQLINKIMKKITSYNCPVRPTVRPVKININKVPKK